MLYVISIGLLFLNLLYAFVKKEQKILSFALMFLAWILFWGNNNNPDYEVYLSIYNSNGEYTTNSLEIGFIVLVKFFNLINFNYEMFLMTISFLAFYLIHTTVRKLTTNYNYVYSLYFLFPLFIDIVQIRNFLMMAIFIYATRFLLENKKIKYLITILLASTFQMSAIALLPFVFINNKGMNFFGRIIFLVSISSSIIILMNGKKIPYIDNLIDFSQSEKLSLYFETTTNYGFVLYWFLQIISFALIVLSRKLYLKYENVNIENSIKMKYINLVYWINVFSFMYLPFYLLNSNFSRLLRNLVILNYIVVAITTIVIKDKNERRLYIILTSIYILILFGILQFPFLNEVIKPVLENNILF